MRPQYSLFAGVIPAAAASSSYQTKCASLNLKETPVGTSLVNITAIERFNVTVQGTRFNTTGTVSNINFCDVQVYLTHGGAGDKVRIALWLPLTAWNGRFMGTGGAGFKAGVFDPALAEGVAAGFAAGATDAGVGLDNDPQPWANSTQLIANFVHLSVHEMTVVGKTLTTSFYGQKPAYSYWHGCSQGGRQGYVEALLYPQDYDGISANAPAINWDRLLPGFLWPYLQTLHKPVEACKLAAITAASIPACDLLDGGADGLIVHPPDCDFNAQSMVGKEAATCNNDKIITAEDAAIWNSIRAGPKDKDGKLLWYGVEPGTDLSFLTFAPFPPADQWLKSFILRDPGYNSSSLTYEQYLDAFATSVAEFGESWGSPDADLSPFKKRGGKLITFHGWADQSIPAKGTIEYWNRVGEAISPGSTNSSGDHVNEFYRLFMAAGVGHCANFGYGPGPLYVVEALVKWVEEGTAPDALFAAGFGQTRNLCYYPRRLKYNGVGKLENAESWSCI
jgi:feruloyl esterase